MAQMILTNVSPRLEEIPSRFRKLVKVRDDGDFEVDGDEFANAFIKELSTTIVCQLMAELDVTVKDVRRAQKEQDF